MDEKRLKRILKTVAERLGYSQLREKQQEVVLHFLRGADVFVSLPTGSGKTLCYSVLPSVFDEIRGGETSIVIVVSPLVSLMVDQVASMMKKNIKAVYVGQMDKTAEVDVCEGKYQMVYMSPESLLGMDRWRDMLLSPIYHENLVAVIVDEAHCVKKWGKEFRTEFSRIGEIRSLVPETVRFMALTATATASSRKEICRILGMRRPQVVSTSPNKPNIKYIVCEAEAIEESFLPFIEELRTTRTQMEKVIIFCRTYESCGMIYMLLKNSLAKDFMEPVGAPDRARYRLVDMYTACTREDVKRHILDVFPTKHSKLRVVVATVAFGMGLDCPDVQRIIHWGPSADIEMYIQETGRAGRDGRQARAILYRVPRLQHVDSSMREYTNNTEECRRKLLLKDFDHFEEDDGSTSLCLCCDVCERQCRCDLC